MIYLDSSVALARLLADRLPHEHLWQQQLVSSRLLEYEVWNRIYEVGSTLHGDAARGLIGRVALLELVTPVLVLVPWHLCQKLLIRVTLIFGRRPKTLLKLEAAPMPMLVRVSCSVGNSGDAGGSTARAHPKAFWQRG